MRYRRILTATYLLAATAGACGGDTDPTAARDGTSSTTAASTPTTDAPTAGCTPAELAAIVDVTRDLGIAYDYQPSTSPADLADRAEVVVSGSLGDVEADGDELLFTFDGDEVLRGELDTTAPFTVVVDFAPSARSVDEVREVLVTGADALLFLAGDDEDPTRWHPLLEGMWLSCGDAVAAARVAPIEWDVASLDELADAVRTSD
jgi:hypothetical protein